MSFKKFLKSVVISAIYFCLTLAVSLEAPYVHKAYLRNIGEENSVRIVGKDGMGTGFHVKTKSGKVYILTNKHVCSIPGPLKVEKYGDDIGIVRKIIKKSADHDLCVMEALPDAKGIEIGNDIENGESVYTLGHPRGDALTIAEGEKIDELEIQLVDDFKEDGSCEGEVIRQEGWFGPVDYCVITRRSIQFSTPTYPGNSGSPVVNKYGNLVSVVFAGNRNVENMGFGVPLDYVKTFLSSLK